MVTLEPLCDVLQVRAWVQAHGRTRKPSAVAKALAAGFHLWLELERCPEAPGVEGAAGRLSPWTLTPLWS